MGSCISKCRPKKRKFKEDCQENFSHVHDKLVISQAPVSPIPSPFQKSVSPSPSAASSTSFSSFSGATSSGSSGGYSAASSLSTSSSCSSSISITKDRLFSNEFLWSCVKENPHIIGRNFVKANLEKSGNSTKVHPRFLEAPLPENPVVPPLKQTIPERHGGSTPKKRSRANSPTLVRQKSFRKEPDRVSSAYHLPSRTLRSPSPSRRFNGENSFRDSLTSSTKDIYSKRSVMSKPSPLNSASASLRKESFRSPCANYESKDHHIYSRSCRNTFNHQIGSKIEEIADAEAESNQELDSMIIDDVNNPLISLDCFIFL